MKHRVVFFTGPTLVNTIAERFRQACIEVYCEGTEHVIVKAEGNDKDAARWNALAQLNKVHGTDFGLR